MVAEAKVTGGRPTTKRKGKPPRNPDLPIGWTIPDNCVYAVVIFSGDLKPERCVRQGIDPVNLVAGLLTTAVAMTNDTVMQIADAIGLTPAAKDDGAVEETIEDDDYIPAPDPPWNQPEAFIDPEDRPAETG
jgi:hypothetical protein